MTDVTTNTDDAAGGGRGGAVHQLVLRQGVLADPSHELNGRTVDVAIDDGIVTALAPEVRAAGGREVDCRGIRLAPGLIDYHVHVYAGVSNIGITPDDAVFSRGAVACMDAGSSGSTTFGGFRSYIAEPAERLVLAYLNVSALGLVDFRHGELLDPTAMRREDALAVVEANRDLIRGLKLRLSRNVIGGESLEILDQALAVADEARLSLMVHIGNTDRPLKDFLERLRPGDVVTHVYTGNENGILVGGSIHPAVWEARERGVLFDLGHGRTQLSYEVSRIAMAEGFPPDFVSSDISGGNWRGPTYDLATIMSKMIVLGMSFDEVITATTARPAVKLGIDHLGYGAIGVGRPAYVTALTWAEQPALLPDAVGAELEVPRLEPLFAVVGSEVAPTVPWRGNVESH